MIEKISSCNGLQPLSNVHLLRVTDLLQRKECCCYKLKTSWSWIRHLRQLEITSIHEAYTSVPKFLVVKILSALQFTSARELHTFIQELPTVISLHHHSSSEALSLSLLRPQILTWENSHQIICCTTFLILSESPISCFNPLDSLVLFYI